MEKIKIEAPQVEGIKNVILTEDEQSVLKANMERLAKVKVKNPKGEKKSSKPKKKARKIRVATNSLADFFPK
jgi:hypothetical protein